MLMKSSKLSSAPSLGKACYLPEVLWHVVLQLALHQVAKQGLDLVEDAFLRLVCVVLNGKEGLE